jgi:hypothetical protein
MLQLLEARLHVRSKLRLGLRHKFQNKRKFDQVNQEALPVYNKHLEDVTMGLNPFETSFYYVTTFPYNQFP